MTNADFSPAMDENRRQKTLPGIGVWEVVGVSLGLKIGAFLCVAVIGVGIGLVISALVRSTTQAVMWVPLVLIPQILFGGFVISMPEMSGRVRQVAQFFPSFSGQRLIDVSHLYGRRAPKLTNQTKTPTFLTSDGEKETVEWQRDGNTISQDFESPSEVNISWQNLAVRHEAIGHHEHATDDGYEGSSPTKRETVESREDVKYQQGTVYQYLYPAGVAASTLGIWLAIGFMIMQVGLRLKK
ncbi:MAG: ABC transporter permease [Akkermansiaceae bacterium]|nr:ABC transporter permease [Akkermansiaceae bacterium]